MPVKTRNYFLPKGHAHYRLEVLPIHRDVLNLSFCQDFQPSLSHPSQSSGDGSRKCKASDLIYPLTLIVPSLQKKRKKLPESHPATLLLSV